MPEEWCTISNPCEICLTNKRPFSYLHRSQFRNELEIQFQTKIPIDRENKRNKIAFTQNIINLNDEW